MSKGSKHNLAYLGVKRGFDILVSGVGCVFLLPFAAGIKIANLLHGDKGPLFYKHPRIGKNGKIFNLYKFRTMEVGAEDKLDDLKKSPKYREEWKKYGKIQDDPRVTKVGKYLRHSSMDELPQLINILKGNMSLIGPRPLVEGELEEFGGDHKRYEAMRPGLTGWWAANGRSNLEYKRRLDLEYYYVDHASIGLDLKTIGKTFGAVCGGEKKGAK